MLDTAWVINQIGDEFGLNEQDLAAQYGVDEGELTEHLQTLGDNSRVVYERILSDLDAVRIGYRQVEVTDGQIATIRARLADYRFHPLVHHPLADGSVGWRLSGDDAQWVAFRASDAVGLSFEQGETLRLRLHRLVIWREAASPPFDQRFRDRVADVTFYLVELSGIV